MSLAESSWHCGVGYYWVSKETSGYFESHWLPCWTTGLYELCMFRGYYQLYNYEMRCVVLPVESSTIPSHTSTLLVRFSESQYHFTHHSSSLCRVFFLARHFKLSTRRFSPALFSLSPSLFLPLSQAFPPSL